MAADIDPSGSSILRYFTDSYGDIVACYNSCIMQHYVIINLERKISFILIRMESEEPRLSLYYGVGSYLVIGAPLEEPPA